MLRGSPCVFTALVSTFCLSGCIGSRHTVERADQAGAPALRVGGRPVPPMICYASIIRRAAQLPADGKWHERAITFTAPQDDPGGVAVHIRFGAKAGRVWIDNVRFHEGTIAEAASDNAMRGGGFETGMEAFRKDWRLFVKTSVGAKAEASIQTTDPASGRNCLEVAIDKPGSAVWHVHLFQQGHRIRQGRTYTFRAMVKTDVERPMDMICVHQGEPWTMYSTDAQEYPPAQIPGWDEIELAGAEGFHIHSFALPTPWIQPGKEADFSAIDAKMRTLLERDPNALLIPRFGMGAPGWWLKENPDDAMLYHDGSTGMSCVGSDKWRTDSTEALRRLVRYMEENYGDHVLGYHPCGQNTGEWFYDQSWSTKLSGFSPAMERAFRTWAERTASGDVTRINSRWGTSYASFGEIEVPTVEERKATALGAFRDPIRDRRVIDYYAFLQQVMVEPLERYAEVIKEETAGSKLVVLFYGYTFEMCALPLGPQISGHLALRRLLDSPHVDVLCSPISYFDRQPGGIAAFMCPVDSVQLHGKLWLNEDDTRTHLSAPDAGFGRVGGEDETRWVHQRNFAHVFSRRCACWYMDLPGQGWLNSKDIWQHLGRLRDVYAKRLAPEKPYAPEAAVVIDEDSLLYLEPSRRVTRSYVYEFRRELYRTGAPLAFYLLDDVIERRTPPAKVYFFLNAFYVESDRRKKLVARLRDDGATAVWFYAPGLLDENGIDTANMEELTGIRFSMVDRPVQPSVRLKGNCPGLDGVRAGDVFGDQAPKDVSPTFAAVKTEGLEVFGEYVDSGLIAAALKRNDGWTSMFIGGPRPPVDLLASILKSAGGHVWVEPGDVVSTDGRLLCLHACEAGVKTVSLPSPARVVDAMSREEVAARTQGFSLALRKGETRLLILEQ